MNLTPGKINAFLFLRLPAAFFCGVRVKSITIQSCTTTVTHRWINQNPFKSMYFAVQAMAAELSTGALLLSAINSRKVEVSMLVRSSKSVFVKKATGKITFTCNDGAAIIAALASLDCENDSQSILLKSAGMDQSGEMVCEMEFEWGIKLKHVKPPLINI